MDALASIGFRLHTGWAILVGVSAESEALQVLHRCRIELLPAGRGRFVYHQAAELPLIDARKLIETVRHDAEQTARMEIERAIKGLKVSHACIPTGSALVPDDLAVVLRSHARIHGAEGALYAGVTASACAHLGIPTITVSERDVWKRASASAGLTETGLKSRIDAVRETLGPPWTADHKVATAAALLRV